MQRSDQYAQTHSLSFDDAGSFARALTQAEVSCFQTNAGAIQLGLSICKTSRIEVHFTSMPVGSCIAIGRTAGTTQSFHVPLQNAALISMMGRQMDGGSFAAYSHDGEHAINACAGARLAYIVPTEELIQEASFVHRGRDATRSKARCDVVASQPEKMARLSNFLEEVSHLIENAPGAIKHFEVLRQIEQSLMGLLLEAHCGGEQHNTAIGRVPVSRCRILREIDDLLRIKATEPVYVTDLCSAAGISQPTLYRIFFDVLDMNPKRYLQLRRLHLVREKLLDDASPARTVSSVAFDCGFWQLGRFGQAYRELFGETPSQTLKRSRRTREMLRAAG